MIFREDIYQHCKECVNEPLGNISIAHQIACCTFDGCLLHDERPILVTDISPLMMEYFQVSTDLLCERARRVAEPDPSRSVEDEIEFLLDEIIETDMIVFVTDGEP
jgi:hypothetical protein